MNNRQPVFFIGHGSPMNAIEDNICTQTWRTIGAKLSAPRAILCVSAHWVTEGSRVTANLNPKTIHDFGGFPAELYRANYPAPGSPAIAEEIRTALKLATSVDASEEWGLDHGTWSILMHLRPAADIPVLQLSIDATTSDFMKLGAALKPLRDQSILIIGSGNIVHNLRLVNWHRLSDIDYAFDWAREADAFVAEHIKEKKWDSLQHFNTFSESMKTAVNSAEHFIPLLYILGAAYTDEPIEFFNQTAVAGALTMTSVRFG